MTHTERCTSIEEIRKKINPQYAGTIGTESFERQLLIDVIDELEAANQQLHAINRLSCVKIAELEAEQPTLRDRFAMAAMNAYIGEVSFGSTAKGILYPKHDLIATYSYEMADEMIKARKEVEQCNHREK